MIVGCGNQLRCGMTKILGVAVSKWEDEFPGRISFRIVQKDQSGITQFSSSMLLRFQLHKVVCPP